MGVAWGVATGRTNIITFDYFYGLMCLWNINLSQSRLSKLVALYIQAGMTKNTHQKVAAGTGRNQSLEAGTHINHTPQNNEHSISHTYNESVHHRT